MTAGNNTGNHDTDQADVQADDEADDPIIDLVGDKVPLSFSFKWPEDSKVESTRKYSYKPVPYFSILEWRNRIDTNYNFNMYTLY